MGGKEEGRKGKTSKKRKLEKKKNFLWQKAGLGNMWISKVEESETLRFEMQF